MKRKKGLLSARRRASRVRLTNRLTDKMSKLVREGKIGSTLFKKLDSQLAKLQKAAQFR